MTSAPIALSLGDPAGIGPEIIAAAWLRLRQTGPSFFAIGDGATLARAAGAIDVRVKPVESTSEAAGHFGAALPVMDLPLDAPAAAAQPDRAAAAHIIEWIETGARLALAREAAALVTAPVAKALLYDSGFAFPGHTEFLGQIAGGAGEPVMMLTAENLRCALVTIHEPLARVSSLLDQTKIIHAGTVTAAALQRDFGVSRPRLAIAALNPHAGEDGALGREEGEIIAPAVRALREAGVDARGPLPADSLFHADARKTYDGVLCMYHDQALIPVKMLDFWSGVNVTLGLRIVRTSPDHGVAYDLAGKGLARPDSLISAIRMAHDIATRRAEK